MATTINISITQSETWTAIGGTENPIAFEHLDSFKFLSVAFTASSSITPSIVSGHKLEANLKETGIIGSQAWARSTSGTIVLILTE